MWLFVRFVCFFKQKTAYEMRISDWSSDVCSSDLPPFNHDDYVCVTDEATLDSWRAEAFAAGVIAVDTETDSVDATRAALVGVSLATAPGRACYIPIGHGGDGLLSEAPKQLPRDLVLAKLRPLLEDEATLKIGHNLKYDLIVLRRAGVDVAPYDDTMLLSYALDRSDEHTSELQSIMSISYA